MYRDGSTQPAAHVLQSLALRTHARTHALHTHARMHARTLWRDRSFRAALVAVVRPAERIGKSKNTKASGEMRKT